MTKKHFLNALMLSAFVALTACAGGGDSAPPQGIMPDDSSQEGSFNPSAPSENDAAGMTEAATVSQSERDAILKSYDYMDPNREVPTKALGNALVYFEKNKSKIRNKKYISVIDFGKRSTQKRFFIINVATGKVMAIHVAHGKGSDADHDGYAEKFSNSPGSKASSIGYYLTGSTYQGSNGYSLKLDGLSSTNSNARGRAVVIHGASYVSEGNVIQGRSWGCPAVAMSLRTQVIDMLKGGSLIYAVAN